MYYQDLHIEINFDLASIHEKQVNTAAVYYSVAMIIICSVYLGHNFFLVSKVITYTMNSQPV
jgi:hypothetical protein